MIVIDNMIEKDTVGNKSTQLKVKEIFVRYLKEVKHPRATQIEALQPERLNIGWAPKTNFVDYGVFVMRHMETCMGITTEKWNCGFPKDPKKLKQKLTLLRKKYAVSLLLSDTNINREKIMKEAKDLQEIKMKQIKKKS